MAAAAPPAPPDYLPAGVSKNEAIAYVDKSVSSDLVHIFNECVVSIGLHCSIAWGSTLLLSRVSALTRTRGGRSARHCAATWDWRLLTSRRGQLWPPWFPPGSPAGSSLRSRASSRRRQG